MSQTITLTVLAGKLRGKDYTFARPGKRLVGRAEGCDVRFPNDWEHLTISRLHCLLEVTPSEARLWDVGSRNGTYVNGRRIGPGRWPPAAEVADEDLEGRVLADGDEIRVGPAVLRVHIADGDAEPEHTEVDADAGPALLT
jgi:pSer/pThr/pTyr-binding forkhead associated (FHA) protein